MIRLKIIPGRINRAALNEAVQALRQGGVVAYPTETSYGLAADPKNPAALRKLFAIKGRKRDKPSPLIAANLAQAESVAAFSAAEKRFIRVRWPGPYTLVSRLKKNHGLSALASGSGNTVALRVPKFAWARTLAAAFGGAITSTSANLSGRPNIYSGAALRRIFAKRRRQPDLILDAGRLPERPPSTILRIHKAGVEVIRQGSGIV